jgi:hypothetical protein
MPQPERRLLPPRPKFDPEELAPPPCDEIHYSPSPAINFCHPGHIRLQKLRSIIEFGHDQHVPLELSGFLGHDRGNRGDSTAEGLAGVSSGLEDDGLDLISPPFYFELIRHTVLGSAKEPPDQASGPSFRAHPHYGFGCG